MIGLTPKLALVAAAIGELTVANNRAPTPAELGRELDMSRGQLWGHLDHLTERGWLLPHGASRRCLVLMHEAPPPPEEFSFEITEEGRTEAQRPCQRHG